MKRIVFAILAALAIAGCRSGPGTRFSAATIGQGFAATNRAGVVISGGQQMNTLLGGDGAFADWKEVATAAAASGNEFSLTVIGHGASRQPDVKRESTNAKKAQDAFGNFVAKAATGDKAGAAESMGEAMFYGSAYAAEMANPPQADEAGFVGAYAAVGPGANLSGLGVAAELRQTRVESIRAARANYSSTVTYAPQDITTTNGLATVNAALPVLADAYKAKLAADAAKISTGGAASPAPATPGNSAGAGSGGVTPPPVAPDSSGSGAVEPSDRPAYDTLTKKNYLYKTRLAANNPVTRHDSAFLIPKDRPAVKSLYIPGQKVEENYFSKSEDRWILRLSGALPNTPASAVATYADGNSETFAIASLAGRTDNPAGPYKPAIKPETPAPVTPDTGAGTPQGE